MVLEEMIFVCVSFALTFGIQTICVSFALTFGIQTI